MYTESYLGIKFKEKYWMIATLKDNEDVLTEWIVNDENHLLIWWSLSLKYEPTLFLPK